MFFEIVVKDFANFIGNPLCYVAVSFNERFRSWEEIGTIVLRYAQTNPPNTEQDVAPAQKRYYLHVPSRHLPAQS